jgi:multidrug efflux pump subunit AcrA (membrane-fusion protein)
MKTAIRTVLPCVSFIVIIAVLASFVWLSYNQVSELQNQQISITSQNGILRNQTITLQTQNDELQSNNTELQRKIEELQTNITKLQNQTNDLENQKSSLQDQIGDLNRQNSALQNQTIFLQNQNENLQNQTNLFLSQLNGSKTNPNVKIADFWQSGGLPIVFGYTAWNFNVTIQNMKNESIRGLSLEVVRIAINNTVNPANPVTKLINYTTTIDLLSPYETLTISDHLGGTGFVGDFNAAGANWVIKLTMPQVIDTKTYTLPWWR